MIKKLSQNIIIYGFTNVIRSLVPFMMLPILTAYLTPEEFGMLSLIEVSILLLFPLVSLNVYAAINVEYFHLKKEELSFYITNAISLSLLSFVLFLCIVILFSEQIEFYVNLSITIIVLLPVFAVLRLLPQVVLGLLQVEQKAKFYFIFTLFQALIDFALSYSLIVIYKNGYVGRLEGIYVSAFFMSGYAFHYLYKHDFLSSLLLNTQDVY